MLAALFNVLLFLLQKAHAFALDRRTEESSIPF